jgi:hypothetical protein
MLVTLNEAGKFEQGRVHILPCLVVQNCSTCQTRGSFSGFFFSQQSQFALCCGAPEIFLGSIDDGAELGFRSFSRTDAFIKLEMNR